MQSSINSICINEDLNVLVTSGENGIVGFLSVLKMQVIKTFKLKQPILNSLILSFPYYMVYIECKRNQQFCYSLNGQELETSELENIYENPFIMKEQGYRERVVTLID